MRTAKTLIRLGRCPGCSESSLGAQVILLVLSCGGSFQPSYWCGSKRSMDGAYAGEASAGSEYFERDPSGSNVGISIRHLRKVRMYD